MASRPLRNAKTDKQIVGSITTGKSFTDKKGNRIDVRSMYGDGGIATSATKTSKSGKTTQLKGAWQGRAADSSNSRKATRQESGQTGRAASSYARNYYKKNSK